MTLARSETQSHYHLVPASYTPRVHIDLLPFLAIAILLIVIPGPDTAMVTKNAVVGGRRSGVLAAVGVSVGLTIWTAAAALGIAALLRASTVGFDALKIAGAVYLDGRRHPAAPLPRSCRGHACSAGSERRPGVPPGHSQRPRQPEDRRLLHEPAAPVRPRARIGLRAAARPRRGLRAADACVARRLRLRGRARLGLASPAGRSQGARPVHRDRPDRLRGQAGARAAVSRPVAV